jgi:putative transposase
MSTSAPQEIRTFFVTTVTAGRRSVFQTDHNAHLLLGIFAGNQKLGHYQLHAFVIMRDHLHLLITPGPEISLERAVQFIKGGFSFRLKSKLPVWQRSFTERRMKDASDFAHHNIYIEQNPVGAGIVQSAEEYSYSSASMPQLVTDCPPHLQKSRG